MVKILNNRVFLTGLQKPYLEVNKTLQLFYNDIRPHKPLKQEEIEKLFTLYHKGTKEERESAFTKICKHNERLVVSMAREYCSNKDNLNDLIQEGNIGLMKAIEQYDASSGASFGGYAVYWIRRYINLFKTNTTPIVPQANRFKIGNSVTNIINDLWHKLERTPTSDEILEEYNKSNPKKTINSKEDLVHVEYFYLDEIENKTNEKQSAKQNREYNYLYEEAASHNEYLDIIEKESIKNTVNRLISVLNKKEAAVVSMLYGLNGNTETSMSTIATELNLTQQRISQLYNTALSKMRKAMEKQSYKFS